MILRRSTAAPSPPPPTPPPLSTLLDSSSCLSIPIHLADQLTIPSLSSLPLPLSHTLSLAPPRSKPCRVPQALPARTVAQSARRKAQALLTQLHDTSLPPSTRAPARYCLSLLCLRCRFPTITIYHHHQPPTHSTTSLPLIRLRVQSSSRTAAHHHTHPRSHSRLPSPSACIAALRHPSDERCYCCSPVVAPWLPFRILLRFGFTHALRVALRLAPQ